MNIGENIQFFRKQAGWSHKELAAHSLFDESILIQFETNQLTPNRPELELLARALSVEVIDLNKISTKSHEDWYAFMVHHPDADKRLNMDESRFRLLLRRMGYDNSFYTNGQWITNNGISFYKPLEDFLSNTTDEFLTVTASWHQHQRWSFVGYIGENMFSIEIKKQGNEAHVVSHAPFYRHKYLSTEFKTFFNRLMKWYQTQFSGHTMKYTLESLLYLEGVTKDELLDMELEKHHLSDRQQVITTLCHPQNDKTHTLRKWIALKKEANTIHGISEKSLTTLDETIAKTEAWLRDDAYHSIAELPSRQTLLNQYPNPKDIPVELIDFDTRVVFPFVQRNLKTIGDIACHTKEELLPHYNSYLSANIIDKIEKTLAVYDIYLTK